MVKTSSEIHAISGVYCFKQPLHLIHYLERITAAVGLAVDLVAAPAAFVRAAASRDEVDGALLVMGSPGVDIAMEIDRLARGPGLCVQIGDLRTRRVLAEMARFIQVGCPSNFRFPGGVGLVGSLLVGSEQLLRGWLRPSPKDDKLRARFQVFLRVGSRFRPAPR